MPADGLPVETRAGEITRISFVRLAGSEPMLRLSALRADGGALGDVPVVAACPITASTWKTGPAQDMSAAPPYDTAACVNGTRDGQMFRFDLSKFPSPTGPNGFALVPVAEVGVSFELVLSRATK